MSRIMSALLAAAALFMLSAFPAFAFPMLSGKDTMDHMPFGEATFFSVKSGETEIAVIAHVVWREDKTFERAETYQIGGWDTPRFFLAEARYRSLGDKEPYAVWIDACIAHGEAPCGEGKQVASGAEAVALIENYFSISGGYDAKIIFKNEEKMSE